MNVHDYSQHFLFFFAKKKSRGLATLLTFPRVRVLLKRFTVTMELLVVVVVVVVSVSDCEAGTAKYFLAKL